MSGTPASFDPAVPIPRLFLSARLLSAAYEGMKNIGLLILVGLLIVVVFAALNSCWMERVIFSLFVWAGFEIF